MSVRSYVLARRAYPPTRTLLRDGVANRMNLGRSGFGAHACKLAATAATTTAQLEAATRASSMTRRGGGWKAREHRHI